MEARSDALIDKPLVLIERLVGLGDDEIVLFVRREVAHLVRDLVCFLIDTAVRRLHETELVHACIRRKRANEADVRTFRGLDRAHAAIMRVMDITHLETRALAREAARAERRETTLMRELRERIVLIHELRELRGAKKLLHSGHDRTDVDERLRRDDICILNRHALAHNALHAREADAELVLQELADCTHATVAEMVDIVRRAHAVHEVQQIINRSDDITLRDGAEMILERWRAEQLHAAAVLELQIDGAEFLAVTKDRVLLFLVDGIDHVLRHIRIRRNDDLARLLVDERIREHPAEDAAAPAELLRELVAADRREVIALRIEKETFKQCARVVHRHRLARTQAVIDDLERLVSRIDLRVMRERRANALIVVEELENLLVAPVAKGADEERHRHLARTVDAHPDDVTRVRLKLDPGTAVRNHRRVIEFLARRIHRLTIVSARRTHELADDDTLRTIDDEGTRVRHFREVTHEDFLFLDLSCLAVDEADIDTHRCSPRHITFLALIEVIFRLAERIALEREHKISREIRDRRNVIENVLKSLIEEPLVGLPLDVEKMRHFHDFFDSRIAIPGSFAHRHRIK